MNLFISGRLLTGLLCGYRKYKTSFVSLKRDGGIRRKNNREWDYIKIGIMALEGGIGRETNEKG